MWRVADAVNIIHMGFGTAILKSKTTFVLASGGKRMADKARAHFSTIEMMMMMAI
jgi:hypothetical protein